MKYKTSVINTTTPKVIYTSFPTSTSRTSATATSTPATDDDCLGIDGSTYADPSTGSNFKIECNVAHEGHDIENLKAESMEECVSLCAKNVQCKGAIWFNAGVQGTLLNYCWLKSSLNDSDIRYTTDAQSVVRL